MSLGGVGRVSAYVSTVVPSSAVAAMGPRDVFRSQAARAWPKNEGVVDVSRTGLCECRFGFWRKSVLGRSQIGRAHD